MIITCYTKLKLLYDSVDSSADYVNVFNIMKDLFERNEYCKWYSIFSRYIESYLG